ncbi:MAG: response regulator transcription factor [Firmicutes bacterium]|nr:response regulator transcription factor [Bacillota bacterium]
MNSLRLVIVDDQKLFRENLKTVLELRLPEVKVVGLAENGREALEVIRATRPDLVLLDMRMPVMDGVECLRRLREEGNDVRVIVLTTFDDDEYIVEALRFGAVGYLLKDIEPEQLTAAIEQVRLGGTLLSPQVTAKLVTEVARRWMVEAPLAASREALAELTPREIEILRHIARGEDNREIAQALHLAEGTVKNYISSIYEKLGLRDRAQAIRFAIMCGLN